MKKLFLLLLVFSFYFLTSCDSQTTDLELEPQTIETFEANQVFFTGEVQEGALQSRSANVSSKALGCGGVIGPDCAYPNQTLTYTFATNNSVTWTVDSGSISISNGQGTNTVSLTFGSDFDGGFVIGVESASPNCIVIFEILKCDSGVTVGGDDTPLPPTCGIDINGIYELNLLGDENVAFYAVVDTSIGWSITGTFFTVTYQNGSTSYHVGYSNSLGHQQIIIPVNCSNKVRKVEANVYGISNSDVNCSDTRIRDWGPIGVCGTGGFN